MNNDQQQLFGLKIGGLYKVIGNLNIQIHRSTGLEIETGRGYFAMLVNMQPSKSNDDAYALEFLIGKQTKNVEFHIDNLKHYNWRDWIREV